MRNEYIGISLFFVVIAALVSLFSHHPADPSLFHGGSAAQVHNLFGVLGAHFSGLLIGLFGLGAFWTPVLLLFVSLHFMRNIPVHEMTKAVISGLILIVATGAFFAVWKNQYLFFGNNIPSGGVIGLKVQAVVTGKFNKMGGAAILALISMISFMLATGTSLTESGKRLWAAIIRMINRLTGKRGIPEPAALPSGMVKHSEPEPEPESPPMAQEGPNQSDTPVQMNVHPDKTEAKGPVKKQQKPPKKEKTAQTDATGEDGNFKKPTLKFLDAPPPKSASLDGNYLDKQAKRLQEKLESFGIQGEVSDIKPGPIITTFEYKPASGVKINKIVSLIDDLALALRAMSIRIVAPIPGRSVIGIEVPNQEREVVSLKDLVDAPGFKNSKSKLAICMGKDIVGNPVVAALDKMPHLLIAGATGTGKSVFLNSLICSFLYKARPDEVKLIMIDPKRIELSLYDGIPHLITPVVTDVKKATNALFWAVKEMEKRYELLSEKRVRNIDQYNRKVEKETEEGNPAGKLPFVVVIIDELADLMMVASRDVEFALTRLAQMARAAGIHLILSTQRPSVDVLTGTIKANFPTRLTFKVSSKIDSRTIIDANGAESLLGDGDMLFLPPGSSTLQRIHGAYISEDEVSKITDFLRAQEIPEYDLGVISAADAAPPRNGKNGSRTGRSFSKSDNDGDYDVKYDEAVELVTQTRQASVTILQRHLHIPFTRAQRLLEMMEKEGVVGPADGVKPRQVLVRSYEDIPDHNADASDE
jgi:S-DNA-T family DNA segregation ATPase FtsK/SpoIIIE